MKRTHITLRDGIAWCEQGRQWTPDPLFSVTFTKLNTPEDARIDCDRCLRQWERASG